MVATFGPVQAVRGAVDGARTEDGSTGSEPDSFPTTLDRTRYGTWGFRPMQCKRRRNDSASTEVGEVSGGRVTQQAFEASTRRTAKSTMQRCQEREAMGRKTPEKKKSQEPASASSRPFCAFGSRLEPWKKSSRQAQGFDFLLPPPALARASRVAYQQSELRQRRHSNWRCTRSGVSTIRKAAAQRELARSRSIPVSAKPAGKPLPPSLHRLLPIFTVALAVSQACLKGGKRAPRPSLRTGSAQGNLAYGVEAR